MSPSANNSVAYPEPCTGNHDDKFFVVGFSLGQSRVPQETKGAQRVLCIPHSVAGRRISTAQPFAWANNREGV